MRGAVVHSLVIFGLILCPSLPAAPPGFDPVEGADETESHLPGPDAKAVANQLCRQIIAELDSTLHTFLEKHSREFSELKDRVVRGTVTEASFNEVFLRLVNTVLFFKQRLLLSHEIDGQYAFDHYLLGVCLWANNYRDLAFAIDVFYRQPRLFEANQKKPEQDWDLEFFAARMVWVVEKYEIDFNRRRAVMSLDDFDDLAANQLHVHWDHVDGNLKVDRLGPDTSQRLLDRHGIRVPNHAVSPLSLQFNNGRRYTVADLRQADIWAVKQLQKEEPNETFVGVGDQSVRLFFRIFRVVEGYVDRFPYSADFLSLIRTNAGWSFIVREMKFANPDNAEVDIEHALNQLHSTWLAVADRYQSQVPVAGLEIVLPLRTARLNGSLGKGYTLGKRQGQFRANVSELLEDGQRVTIEVNGITIPVYVRQLPITQARWADITKADRNR